MFGQRKWQVANTSNNVINFADKLLNKQLDEYGDYLEEEYDEQVETINYIYDAIMDACAETGVADDSDEFVKDFAYVMEAVQSMVNRQFGEFHTFQKVIDKQLKVTRDEDGWPIAVDWIPKLTPKE
jgi:CRISPR/Cas system CSM-associated protein Csm2 small subunit